MKVVSFLAIALVLATAVTPSAACCLAKSGAKMSAMHASMPCCTDRCRMTASTSTHDQDANLAPAISIARTLAVAIVTVAPVAAPSLIDATLETAFPSPPSFLAQHQFRI